MYTGDIKTNKSRWDALYITIKFIFIFNCFTFSGLQQKEYTRGTLTIVFNSLSTYVLWPTSACLFYLQNFSGTTYTAGKRYNIQCGSSSEILYLQKCAFPRCGDSPFCHILNFKIFFFFQKPYRFVFFLIFL